MMRRMTQCYCTLFLLYVLKKVANEKDDLYETTTVEEKFWKLLNRNDYQQIMVDFLDEMIEKSQISKTGNVNLIQLSINFEIDVVNIKKMI